MLALLIVEKTCDEKYIYTNFNKNWKYTIFVDPECTSMCFTEYSELTVLDVQRTFFNNEVSSSILMLYL